MYQKQVCVPSCWHAVDDVFPYRTIHVVHIKHSIRFSLLLKDTSPLSPEQQRPLNTDKLYVAFRPGLVKRRRELCSFSSFSCFSHPLFSFSSGFLSPAFSLFYCPPSPIFWPPSLPLSLSPVFLSFLSHFSLFLISFSHISEYLNVPLHHLPLLPFIFQDRRTVVSTEQRGLTPLSRLIHCDTWVGASKEQRSLTSSSELLPNQWRHYVSTKRMLLTTLFALLPDHGRVKISSWRKSFTFSPLFISWRPRTFKGIYSRDGSEHAVYDVLYQLTPLNCRHKHTSVIALVIALFLQAAHCASSFLLKWLSSFTFHLNYN